VVFPDVEGVQAHVAIDAAGSSCCSGRGCPFLPWWLFALGQPHTGVVTHHMVLQVVDIFLAVYIFFLLLLFAINRGIISNKDKG
jgi:hypothetical protein